jgi:glycosyltransferase involved in cell wall biosynthesis
MTVASRVNEAFDRAISGRPSAAVQAGASGACPRVLILRCCRAPQFAHAVRVARERNPGAEIVALSHGGYRDALLEAGVDTVIEIPGRRFDIHRQAPRSVARLRRTRFDEVIIPQMTEHPEAHLNLYWFVAALRATRIVILPGEEPHQVRDRRSFMRFTALETICALPDVVDVLIVIGMLLAACVVRRPRVSEVRNRRPRVLHVIPSLGMGGAQRQLAEVVNATPPDQYDVEVLVFTRGVGEFGRQWLKRDDVHVTFLRRWPRLTMVILEILRHCRGRQYDVMHTWLFMANVLGVAAARLAGIPYVVTSVRSLSPGTYTWNRQWWHRIVDLIGSHAADAVTVNAEALAQDHARWAWMRRSRIDVVHNGLDPSRFLADRLDSRRRLLDLSKAPADAVFVGTVGRLAVEKDHALFLRVIREVRRRQPNAHGIIIGDGELNADLQRTAAELGLTDAVSFLGARTDTVRLMAGFDVFVLPSRIEGFPNALLEAAFLGVPAVASRVGGCPDVLPYPEALFDTGDDGGAVNAVLALLEQPHRAAAHADRVRRRALELFTVDRTASGWFRIYDRCLIQETA